MTEQICQSDSLRGDETPAEAARAIADALEFLHQEAQRLDMKAVCELIQRASTKAREFAASLETRTPN